MSLYAEGGSSQSFAVRREAYQIPSIRRRGSRSLTLPRAAVRLSARPAPWALEHNASSCPRPSTWKLRLPIDPGRTPLSPSRADMAPFRYTHRSRPPWCSSETWLWSVGADSPVCWIQAGQRPTCGREPAAPAANLRRQAALRGQLDREQQHRGRPTGIRIQICSLEESRLFRYTMGPLVSPARLELAYSNYGDPLRGRGRYGDLREQVFIPASRIRRQQFVLGVEADLPGLPGERHAGLLWGPVALVVVAGETAGHQVLPGRWPPSRSRDHVIERQVARGQPCATVLAGAAIPEQDPLAGNGPILPRHRSE